MAGNLSPGAEERMGGSALTAKVSQQKEEEEDGLALAHSASSSVVSAKHSPQISC